MEQQTSNRTSLSICKADHIAISTAMIEVIPLIWLLKDLKVAYNVITKPPTVTFKFFKENQRCITVAESKKLLTRTKQIAIKYRHFLNLVDDGVIKIDNIDSKKQLSDILTKPIKINTFVKLRFMLMGW